MLFNQVPYYHVARAHRKAVELLTFTCRRRGVHFDFLLQQEGRVWTLNVELWPEAALNQDLKADLTAFRS